MQGLHADDRRLGCDAHRANVVGRCGDDARDVRAMPEPANVSVVREPRNERGRAGHVEVWRDVDVRRVDTAINDGDACPRALISGGPRRGRRHGVNVPLNGAKCFGTSDPRRERAGVRRLKDLFHHVRCTVVRRSPLDDAILGYGANAGDLRGAAREVRIVRLRDGDAHAVERLCQRPASRGDVCGEGRRDRSGKRMFPGGGGPM